MKRIVIVIALLLMAGTAHAQYVGPGFGTLGNLSTPGKPDRDMIRWSISGAPAPNQIFPATLSRREVFAPNFAGLVASCGTPPSAPETWTVKCAGTPIGTIALSTSCAPTPTTAGGLVQICGPNARFEIDAAPNVTSANEGITFEVRY